MCAIYVFLSAGGTELTIKGRGFPQLQLKRGDTFDINVPGGSVPCNVTYSDYTTVK